MSHSPTFDRYAKATFFEPLQHSEGIAHVFVNGVARVTDGKIVDALPGRVLTRTVRQ